MKDVVAADANRNREKNRFKSEEKKSIDQVFMWAREWQMELE
jgi:hypothetical protein